MRALLHMAFARLSRPPEDSVSTA